MLFLLMIVLPFVELSLLLSVGERIGVGWTLVSVIFTGIVGAQLARREGLRTLLALQKEVQTGAMPGRLLVGGAVIFASGILLMTPGILTDFMGFLGLVPWTRALLVERVFRWVQAAVAEGRFVVHQGGMSGGFRTNVSSDFQRPIRNEDVIIDQTFESPDSIDAKDRK